MEAQQSSQLPNDQIFEIGERMARMETRMDFVATHRDLAAVRSEAAQQERPRPSIALSRQIVVLSCS